MRRKFSYFRRKLHRRSTRGLADKLLASALLSPKVEALSHDGIVHEFIDGETLNELKIHSDFDLGFRSAEMCDFGKDL